MKLVVAGVSYKTAPVELRERLAVNAASLRCSACRLKVGGGLSEVVVVSTCNRVEIYGVLPDRQQRAESLLGWLPGGAVELGASLYVKEDAGAVRHLFAVAGGLDSMVLGETEITGQIKQAYLAAQELHLTGPVTNRLFQTALQTAKDIRTRTQIGRGATSVGSVAVELAESIFDQDLSQKAILIIGAGQMGEACVRHLAKKGPRSIQVCNRSFERAAALAAEFGGQAVRWADLLAAMAGADIVVSSTGSAQAILRRAEVAAVMQARGGRPLFLIDIAVPRDIDPEVQGLDNVYLYDIDDLEKAVRENIRQREQELAGCQAIIEENTAGLLERFAAQARRSPGSARATAPEWGLRTAAGAEVCS